VSSGRYADGAAAARGGGIKGLLQFSGRHDQCL
jgi:hypothetical protein